MLAKISPLSVLRAALAAGTTSPAAIAAEAIDHANGSASRNTYLHFDPAEFSAQATTLGARFPEATERPPLYGVTVSLKDCFDLAGTVTTAGSRFYAERNPPAQNDSAMATRIKAAGGLISGKTHLHPLAYGITGQNPEYGDSLQPRDAALLTGGSSSGAAASVQEGSAMVAIGTDTGGSVRVPAALCGLVGYRASHALASCEGPWAPSAKGLWAGCVPLAPSFDTPGFLLRDPRDLADVASALFGLAEVAPPVRPTIAFVGEGFLSVAEPEVLAAFRRWREVLAESSEITTLRAADIAFWAESREIFGAIQAAEAAAIHAGHFDRFSPVIEQRLLFGASLMPAEIAAFRVRLQGFRANMAALLATTDYLVVPCAPVSRLVAAEDQANARHAILEYTTPFSLAGLPVVSLPGEMVGAPFGTGIQLIAAAGDDASLLAYASALGRAIAPEEEST